MKILNLNPAEAAYVADVGRLVPGFDPSKVQVLAGTLRDLTLMFGHLAVGRVRNVAIWSHAFAVEFPGNIVAIWEKGNQPLRVPSRH